MGYHMAVSNAARLIAKMRSNPRNWRIEDLKVVASRMGVDHDQHGTSHVGLHRAVTDFWFRIRLPSSPRDTATPRPSTARIRTDARR